MLCYSVRHKAVYDRTTQFSSWFLWGDDCTLWHLSNLPTSFILRTGKIIWTTFMGIYLFRFVSDRVYFVKAKFLLWMHAIGDALWFITNYPSKLIYFAGTNYFEFHSLQPKHSFIPPSRICFFQFDADLAKIKYLIILWRTQTLPN